MLKGGGTREGIYLASSRLSGIRRRIRFGIIQLMEFLNRMCIIFQILAVSYADHRRYFQRLVVALPLFLGWAPLSQRRKNKLAS
ncbi:hypothetical protein F4818DRAFT_427161 [Hypoxylon cercidicola]|nr:hypothetical protein F4818DRAFT_427161 [Hypoxylon cercidicola]